MSKIDKIKERISHLRFWLGICIALIISLGGWIISNLESLLHFKYRAIIGLISIVLLVLGVFKINKKIENYINELEDL